MAYDKIQYTFIIIVFDYVSFCNISLNFVIFCTVLTVFRRKENTMSKVFKQACNIGTTILVIAVVIFVILLAGVRLAGIKPYAVLSGSMEPEYPVGSLIYVKNVDTNKLKVGDDITFMLDEDTLATHRIIEVIPDEKDSSVVRFKTKGIANEYADSGLVRSENVVGKPVFDIPYLGYVSSYIQNPPGLYIAIAGGIVILALAFLPDLFKDKPKKAESSGESPETHLG